MDWNLYQLIQTSFFERQRSIPSNRYLHKIKFLLEKANIIIHDSDYKNHYRVVQVNDSPSEDIVCLIDRFCYISHLSAMQKWGLTNRRSKDLIITRPNSQTVKEMISEHMKKEEAFPRKIQSYQETKRPLRLVNISHPKIVRTRPIRVRSSRILGKSIKDKNGFASVSTIGQTFLDMLKNPELCGGMEHVLEIWEEHARQYLESIILSINGANSIVKCRAGYIIDERLSLKHPAVEMWQKFAQRGGSKRLDPRQPYIPEWSEKWMISINA